MSDHVHVWRLRGQCHIFDIRRARPFRANRPTAEPYISALERSMAGRLTDFRWDIRLERPSLGCLWVADEGISFLEYTFLQTDTPDWPCYSEVTRWVAAEWIGQNGYELPPPLQPRDDPRKPTAEQLRAVTDSLSNFLRGHHGAGYPVPWKREDHYYPLFVALADALHAVRPVAASCQGWTPEVDQALPVLIETFDKVAEAWGWGPLADSEPRRLAYRDERFAWFRAEIARPYYEAALSAQGGWRGRLGCPYNEAAKQGREHGFTATMPPEEGAARFPEAERAYFMALRLGKVKPEVGEQENATLIQANYLLKAAVDEAERKRWTTPAPDPTPTTSAPPRLTTPGPSGETEAKPAFEASAADDPVGELRKAGLPIQAALVEYLLPRKRAAFNAIKHEVHGDEGVSDDAVRKRVSETNKSLVMIGSKLKLSTASGYVFLDDPPE